MNVAKKWRVVFYRDKEKTDPYFSCFVYGVSADFAMDYCKGYFKLNESKLSITLEAVEV